MSSEPSILAASDFFFRHVGLLVAAGIVVVGLLIFGFKDLLRLSPARIWAVSSVSFTDAIRRRVLWITPLAIVGVILVSQFQKPVDELDAIRQTTKFCLFATGMLVTLTAIILACTNLPKEIENRVIFTIVTKPTTRLEIVLGKVVGFACVSAAILLIMGVFTYGYLHLRSWTMQREVSQRLEAGEVDPALRPTLEHYVSAGLLNAKEFYRPQDLNFYSRLPGEDTGVRFTSGASEQSIAIPFEVPADDLPVTVEAADGLPPMRFVALVEVRPTKGETATEDASAMPATAPTTQSVRIPYLPGMEPDAPPDARRPAVFVEVLDRDFFTLVPSNEINGGRPIEVAPNEVSPVAIELTPANLAAIRKTSVDGSPVRFHIGLRGAVPGYEYGTRVGAAQLGYASPSPDKLFALEYPSVPASPDALPISFRGRMGNHGQQLRGDVADVAPVAVYRYRNQEVDETGEVPVEVRSFIERSGVDDNDEGMTNLQLQVFNRKSNTLSDPVVIHPENGRTAYANLPASAMAGGNFDLVLKVTSPGHWISLNETNLALVEADRSFALNLFKSLFILWLLAILVVAIAVFCSTFLSWPIAVVLTVVILLGRWGVLQLGDALTPGIGRQVVTDLKLTGAAESQVVSNTVESLSRALQALSSVLPDISRFAVTEDIERGIWIPLGAIGDGLMVLLLFGLPLIVLSYVIFRNKEVAP
ncbi:MAG TPA: ABC transporter permease subunit [Tepidisphaeraceae bacterium]|jgi:ABC-type transport system involved in multi-copper enzyme maturation permease subunit|nr:ABC transporter permease subunit [Tepidisphaeraceae bacterium]